MTDLIVKQELPENDDKTLIEHYVDENGCIWNSLDEMILRNNRKSALYTNVNSSFREVKLENNFHLDESLMKTEDTDHQCITEIIETRESYKDKPIKTEDQDETLYENRLPERSIVKVDDSIAEDEHLNIGESTYPVSDIDAKVNIGHIHLQQKKPKTRICRSLKYHVKHSDNMHPQLTTYQCNFCDFTSTKTGALKRHVDGTHLQQKSFKCTYCDYVTSQKYRLRYHVEGVHLKMNKYKCNLCNYAAAVKSNLDRHIDCVHVQHKNYVCDFCDYTAKQKNYLKIHIERVHANVKPHNCQMCSYSSTRKNDLQRHMDNIHLQLRNQKCPFCEYATTQKGNIKRHVKRVHSEQKVAINDNTIEDL